VGRVRPTVSNEKLGNYVEQLYKHRGESGVVGDGTTMDALPGEVAAESGRHIQKSQEIVRGLNKWIAVQGPNASESDVQTAISLRNELQSLLGPFGVKWLTRYIARTVAFIGWMAFRSPVLLPLLQEHLEDNEGEVLPHVLLFQIRKWVEQEVEARGETDDVRVVVESLKVGLQDGDYELWALIRTSFIDDLPESPHPASRLRRILEPDV
jgi:hypothetical protein